MQAISASNICNLSAASKMLQVRNPSMQMHFWCLSSQVLGRGPNSCSGKCANDSQSRLLSWCPCAAAVIAGVDNIHIKPGAKVLYLGAASGTSVSHVSDIVGPQGAVYAVEFSHRSGAG